MRVLFTAQDSQTIRDAFAGAKPNSEYASLYAARRPAPPGRPDLQPVADPDRDPKGVIGVGRVKTPTWQVRPQALSG